MSEWLLIYDRQPLPGPWNMAVDEYLFNLAKDGHSTFLRFYTWLRPTASLGCSQNINKVLNFEECQKRGVDIVRRMTGGKLVLHHLEVTYSVTSSRSDIFTTTLENSYRLISEALISGLKLMGLPANLASSTPSGYARSHLPCFAYPARNEVEVNNKKVIGSAQKRAGPCFLQHGSIPLVKEIELLAAISYGLNRERQDNLSSLSDALGQKIEYQEAVDYLIDGFRQYFQIEPEIYQFCSAELDVIKGIEKKKYANWQWTAHRIEPEEI